MKVYRGLDKFSKIQRAVVTTGTFDGVHIGHRTILNRLIEVARKIDGESVLLTFYPHPRIVLQPDSELRLLNTIEEKIKLLASEGIDHLIIHPFTIDFSRTTSLEFVRDILVNQIGTEKLVIGYDHHFGRNREGSFEHLKEFGPLYGFEVEEIPAQEINDVNVSSTKIRLALEEGDVRKAAEYLGHQYQLTGKVVHGQKLGRKLGFPTANLEIESPHKLIPSKGIYAVNVLIDEKQFQGMLNIGVRPTIDNNDGQLTIEVNIFDFDEEIYNQEISLQLVQRIRDEKKFDDINALIREMEIDKSKTLAILK